MTVTMGINGFGRIGRALLRVTLQRPDLLPVMEREEQRWA